MAKIHLIGAAVLAAALVAGCDKKSENPTSASATTAKDPNQVVLKVNGKELTRGAIDVDVEKVIKFQGDKIPADRIEDAKNQISLGLAQQFIIETVFGAKAEELGYKVTEEDLKKREEEFLKSVEGQSDAPKSIDEALAKFSPFGVERGRKEFNNGILLEKMFKGEFAKQQTADYTAEAQKIIDGIVSNNASLLTDEQALAKIKGIKAELDAVADADKAAKFAELAKANSDCPSGQEGGDLNYFTQGRMVKEFDAAAFSQEVGVISDPVKTDFGYHLILVTDKKPAVEAKDDKPAEPEQVRASHILVKVGKAEKVPTLDEVKSFFSRRDERRFMQEFMMTNLKAANIIAVDEFKSLLPPPDEPVAAEPVCADDECDDDPAEVPAEKPAEESVEKPAEK